MAPRNGSPAGTRAVDTRRRVARWRTVLALTAAIGCVVLAIAGWLWLLEPTLRLEPDANRSPDAPARAQAAGVETGSEGAHADVAPVRTAIAREVRVPRVCRLVAELVSAKDRTPVEGARCGLSVSRDDPDLVFVPGAVTPDLTAEVVSDRDGRIGVDVDASRTRRWRISISRPGQAPPAPVFVTVPAGATRFDCGRIELPPFAEVRLRVRQFGRPVSGVSVYAWSCDPERSDPMAQPSFTLDLDAPHGVTDRAGEAILGLSRGSRIRVFAAANGTRVTWADLSDSTALLAGEQRELEIELPSPSPLSCLLHAPADFAGTAVLRLHATKQGFALQRRVIVGTAVEMPDPWVAERVQASASLETGNVWLTAYLSGPRPEDDRLRLELGPFQHSIDVRWDASAGDSDGEDARITLGLLREGLLGTIGDETVSLPVETGRALLRPQGRAAHRVVGFHPSHGIAVTELVPEGGRGEPVTLSWTHPVVHAAPVEVLVTDETGRAAVDAIARLSVNVSPAVWPGTSALVFEAPTDDVGRAWFRGVPCGTASVRVRTDGTACQQLDHLTVQPGLNRFAVQLEPLASVAISLSTRADLTSVLPTMRVRTLIRGSGVRGEETTPDATGVAVASDLPAGTVDLTVECMGTTLCKALDWWDPFLGLTLQWVPLASQSTTLVAGSGNRVNITVPDVEQQPAVYLRPASGGTGWRVTATRLLASGRPQGTPRSRSTTWKPSAGISIASLPRGKHVFELLDGTTVRSWVVVDYQGVPLVVEWPGSSLVDLTGTTLPCDELVAWHAGSRLPWLVVPNASPPLRCADGSYQPQVGGKVERGAPVLRVSGGQLSIH